jgi:ATP-dependent RNA helicase DDX51/DBP6
MTKNFKKKPSKVAEVRGEHDAAWEDMDYNGEGDDGHMLDSEEVHDVVPDRKGADAVAQAAPEKTARLLRKKKRHRRKTGKGKGDTLLSPAEDVDFERPRKRHKLRSSDDASPGYSHMRSRPAAATATAEDSSRSSPVVPSSSSAVSGSPEPESPTDDPQTLLDHRTRTPASPPPPPSLQRFPLPSRPHAPEKSELAWQGLDRALASAQLVDPLLSTPLSLDDENGDDITGLSARTLRRLRDLGIVELFAGVCVIMSPRFRKPTATELYNFSPDYTAALVPTSRTSEAVTVPPV